MRLAYIAYPIDQATLSSTQIRTIESVQRGLIDRELVDIIFDPGDAFTVRGGAPMGGEIANINQFAASVAEVVVAMLPKGSPTVGVPIEIDRAVRDGKITAILTDSPSWMLQYKTGENIQLFDLTDEGVEAMLNWLRGRKTREIEEPDGLGLGQLRFAPNREGGDTGRGSGYEVRLPTRAYPDDAGLDLYVSERVLIPAGQFRDVPCGVAVQLPEGTFGWITGRSSALRKRGLLVHTGIIDVGYRGPLFAGAFNLGSESVVLEPGQRVAQMIIMPNLTEQTEPVMVGEGELTYTDRGDRGFGSSGA